MSDTTVVAPPPQKPSPMAQAFSRLGMTQKKGRIPFVQGVEAADCGAASLAMVLGYFGRHEPLAEVHAIMQPGRDGVTARTIAEAATGYGLVPRALSVPQAAWKDMPPASIIHWRFNHFVVFDRFDRRGAWLVDPMLGRRHVDNDEFRRSFTGVALTFSAGERFEKREAGASRAWDLLAIIFKEKRLLVHIGLTSLVIQLIGLVFPALTSLVIDQVLPRGDFSLLNLVSVGVVLIIASQAVAELIRSYMLSNMKVVIDARMTLRFFEHLLALPYAFFQRHTDGDLLMRLGSNAMIREILTGGVFSAILDGSMVLGYLVIVFALKPMIGFVVLAASVLILLPFWVTKTARVELSARYLDARTKSESLEVEVLRAVETIKAMGLEPEMIERWTNLFVDTLNFDVMRDRLGAGVRTFEETIRQAVPLIVLVMCATLGLKGEMATGEMLALSTLTGLYISRIGGLAAQARGLQVLGTYLDRIVDVMDSPVEATGTNVVAPNVRGEIVAQNLSFRYNNQAPLVVDNVSINIPPGTAVAFVGGSGSGKSSLVKLLAGLYLPTSGEIRMDGVSIAELDLNQYRKRISVVTQETHLFAGSIRQNLALATRDVALNEIIAAAKLACIHDEIVAMPMGYETVLTDQGRSLSGGQRQRLALARALVRKPRVLLLDEATSAIDALTEARIKANLDGLHCTRLIVAHRMSTIRDAQQIYVMTDGRLVEQGTHAELIAVNGTYARLSEAQNTQTEPNAKLQ